MAHILITSGPTREFLDPIRFISNQSSGRMGAALAAAALELNHSVTIVSGPVDIDYPDAAHLISVQTTDEMQGAVESTFPSCDGMIAAAAPCDFKPVSFAEEKIKKTGSGISVQFEETEDILASVSGAKRSNQWTVGFALETDNGLQNALKKLNEKNLNLIVLNGPEAMHSPDNHVRVIGPQGVIETSEGPKPMVAVDIMKVIERNLIQPSDDPIAVSDG